MRKKRCVKAPREGEALAHARRPSGRIRRRRPRPQPEKRDPRLYVAGLRPEVILALSSLRKICKQRLAGNQRSKVIDMLKHPRLAGGEQLPALPTLVRRMPVPIRKIIGDLADAHEVLLGMDLSQRVERQL